LLANRLAPFGALAVDRPLDLEQGVNPRTASSASGEITAGFLPSALRRAFSARSAITKNGRRA
jgi:hypothetical protein